MADIADTKKEIVGILNRFLGNDYLLIVFGSYAKGKIDRSSDIDLAVYKDNGISAKAIAQIREELDEKVHTLRQIDLINLAAGDINTDLLKSILDEGVIWKKAENSKEFLKNLRRHLANTKK